MNHTDKSDNAKNPIPATCLPSVNTCWLFSTPAA